ncbi:MULTISPECIES: hypothetical protein [unclassified Mycobacterium]|uniref:hypothetical protein n=1 Tax=unclassified Mycobacterium TaxID=2642494 RepID=UPI0029C82805|nr:MULTISPECIES: hypothetical protein [unclassified Mycobacterium]
MTKKSLQDVLDHTPNIVDYLYNETPGPHGRQNAALSPVPAQHTNWRDEQRAWRETAALFDQSHHMPELFLRGKDARRLLSDVGVNSLQNLRPGIAKQFVGCNPRGQIIGDCVLHDLGDETFELISGKTLLNWVQFQAETGCYDVSVERDENTSDNVSGTRRSFRFGMDGPNAGEIFRRVIHGPAPDLPFFHTARVRIGATEVLALRHGMAGHQGVELSGPYECGPAVRDALMAAGAEFGLRQGGTRAYYSSGYESGWIGYPLPAIYTGEYLRAFREWLPADGWEAKYQLGGSFYSPDVEDYYVTPYDLGYDRIVKFDHDFIGRAALEPIAEAPPRRKVTLVWNKDDVTAIFRSLLEPGLPYRYLDLPLSDYSFPQRDEVQGADGGCIGQSTLCGYSFNERDILSLAFVERRYAEPGTEVALIWGEPNGGSRKAGVERHRQLKVRVTVAPNPYPRSVQDMQRASL